MTIALAMLQRTTTGFRCAVACGGHPPPVLVHADGAVRRVGGAGTLVGLFPRVPFDEEEVVLAAGDGLVMFTDGVTEAHGADGLFGEDRVMDVLASCAARPVEDIADALERRVEAHEARKLRDDLAIVALKIPTVA